MGLLTYADIVVSGKSNEENYKSTEILVTETDKIEITINIGKKENKIHGHI